MKTHDWLCPISKLEKPFLKQARTYLSHCLSSSVKYWKCVFAVNYWRQCYNIFCNSSQFLANSGTYNCLRLEKNSITIATHFCKRSTTLLSRKTEGYNFCIYMCVCVFIMLLMYLVYFVLLSGRWKAILEVCCF